jgi:hypothetical protein
MAYSHPGIQRVGPANSDAPTIWSYTSDTTKALTAAADYFLDAYADLTVGDFIMNYATDGGQVLSVTAASSSTVTTAAI